MYLKDNHNRTYMVKDIKSFYSHVFKYHASGTSVHEENGYFFTVDEKFRKKNKRTIFKTYIRILSHSCN